jgi:pimeloyl-ACP methyl ester carboxylesterase
MTDESRDIRDHDWTVGSRHELCNVHLNTGVSLAYAEQGDCSGPALLFLHAWGESLRCFDRLLPLLPSSFRLLAIDQRGHGRADKPADGYDLQSLCADVEGFMDAVGLSSVVLVGSSSGGYVAQQVAVRIPSRVSALVLIGSPRSLRGRPEFAEEVDLLTDPIDPDWARAFVAGFPLCHDVPGWYFADRVRDAALIPADVWRASIAGLTTSPAPTDTGAISTPTLILWGDHDGLLALHDQETLTTAIPASRFVVYEDVGHLVLWEQPERVARDIATFIEGLQLVH